jgi:hypothetical protein
MNERIRELADQAVNSISDHIDFDIPDVFKTKFAELIVGECMEVASPNYMNTPEDSAYYVELAIDRIADHFGVQE